MVYTATPHGRFTVVLHRLADVLQRINDHPASRLHEPLPWNWRKPGQDTAAAA